MYLQSNFKNLRTINGLSQSEMAKKLGCSRDNIASYERGTEPKLDILIKIVNLFHIPIENLVNDDLSDYTTQEINTFNLSKESRHRYHTFHPKKKITEGEIIREEIDSLNKNKGIPLIPIDAMAGWGSGNFQIMEYESDKYVIPEFEELNVDFMIRVKGNSMQPKYSSGFLVACVKLQLGTFFQWNKVYVLDTSQGALIKRVKKSKIENHIMCVSDNESYDAFDLNLEEVYSLAIVVGVIGME